MLTTDRRDGWQGFNASIARYYTREELSTRIAIFFASASISGGESIMPFYTAKIDT